MEITPNLPMVFCKKGKHIVKAIPVLSNSSYFSNESDMIVCSDVTLELEDKSTIIRTFYIDEGQWKTKAKDIFLNVLDLKSEFLKTTGYDTFLMVRQREAKYNQFVTKYCNEYPELVL